MYPSIYVSIYLYIYIFMYYSFGVDVALLCFVFCIQKALLQISYMTVSSLCLSPLWTKHSCPELLEAQLSMTYSLLSGSLTCSDSQQDIFVSDHVNMTKQM